MGTLYCHGSGWAQRLRCTNFVSLGCCNKILQTREINGTVPGGSAVKNPPANAGDSGSIPGSVRSPGGGHGNPLQYSCPENPMDRGAWQTTVHGVAKSWTRLRRLSTHRGLNSRNFSLTGLQADEAKADSLISVFLFLQQG